MLCCLKSLSVPALEWETILKMLILPKFKFTWSPCLTATQLTRLEKMQKGAVRIILGTSYTTYDTVLATLHVSKLAAQYIASLRKFGSKLLNNPHHHDLLPPNTLAPNGALNSYKFVRVGACTDRYKHSAIPTLVRLFNEH